MASLESPGVGYYWSVPSKDAGSPMQVHCGDSRLMSEAVNKVKKGAVSLAEPNIAARRGSHEYLEGIALTNSKWLSGTSTPLDNPFLTHGAQDMVTDI